MSTTTKNKVQTYRLTGLGILTAIIIVLQISTTLLFRLTAFSITLTLVPIVVGAAMFGVAAATYLGAVFGSIVAILVATGFDPTGAAVLAYNPALCIILCILKGTLAGLAAGLFYKLFEKKNKTVATFAAAVISPVVNTGTFILGMVLFFKPLLEGEAAEKGQSILLYAIIALTGINFLIEFGVNIILSPIIVKIVDAVKKTNRA